MSSHTPAATRSIPISKSLQDGLINAKICRFIAPAASFDRTVYGECGIGLSPEQSSTTTRIGLSNSFVGVEIVTKQIAGRDVQIEAASDLELETTVERMVSQRIGQERLRRQLLSYWNWRCALTHLNVVPLLRASHIKPWKDSTDSERLDEFNGLLLAPHIDAAFDRGFITFEDDGRLVVASALNEDAQQLMVCLCSTACYRRLHEQRCNHP